MVSHDQGEPPAVAQLARGERGYAVLEMPVGVVRVVHRHAGQPMRVDDRPHAVGFVSQDDIERRDPSGGGRLKCSQDQRLSQHRVEQLRVMWRVLEAVAVTGGQDDGVPQGDV